MFFDIIHKTKHSIFIFPGFRFYFLDLTMMGDIVYFSDMFILYYSVVDDNNGIEILFLE